MVEQESVRERLGNSESDAPIKKETKKIVARLII